MKKNDVNTHDHGDADPAASADPQADPKPQGSSDTAGASKGQVATEVKASPEALKKAGITLPDKELGPRRRLCALLGLSNPTDAQLFEDAADEIETLRAKNKA